MTKLHRGWFLFALTLGLFTQFAQFFKSNTIIFDSLTASDLASMAPQLLPHFSSHGSSNNNIQVRVDDVAHNNNNNNNNNNAPSSSSSSSQQENDGVATATATTTAGAGSSVPVVFSGGSQLSYDLYKPLEGVFDYTQPAVATEFTLPPPKRTNQSTIILCFSARDNFERRAAIRETWAKGNDNVYFVLGGPVPGDKEDMNKDDPLSTSSMLFREQQLFRDIIDTIHPDTYKGLPFKLHFGMRWVIQNLDNVHWVVKADDDVVVRVKRLNFFVLDKMNPFFPQVIGTVVVGAKPHRSGKWKEDPIFAGNEYPPWAYGSSGYVVSQPVAQYVANNDLYYYQGEDAGLGIWLSQSGMQITWVDTPELRKNEGCEDKLYIIGHDLNTDAIRKCFGKLGDEVPRRNHVIAYTAGRKDQHPGRIKNPAD